MGLEVNLLPHDTPRYAQDRRLQLIGPEGSWKHFYIGESRVKQTDVLDSVHHALRFYASNHDTVSGIWITLERQASYETFVLILDWLNFEAGGCYAVDGSDIWVPRFLKSSEIESSENEHSPLRFTICGNGLAHREPAQPTRGQVFEQMLSGYSFLSSNSTYPVVIAILAIWGGILMLNIYRLRALRKPAGSAP
jgi:hypothetical protein